ncbi:hypothetical protein NL676_000860 [Syzygium grande]|nr:hypothetical protein NL676_000860 [Syzygium grande]
MDHRSEIWATRNERLEALKARYVPTPDNQQQFGAGDLNKIMDRYLYEATKEGDVEEFISALENVSKLRKLALSLIFEQVASSGNSLLHVAASSGKDDLIELILDHFPYLVTRKNFSEDTLLHVAVRNGSLKATEMLIRRGTNLEIKYWKNKDGKSPLYLAVEICKICDSNPEGVGWRILELLVREFARDEAYAVKIEGMSPVLATDKNGSHPIHIACEGSSSSTFETLLDDTWPDLVDIKNNMRQNILHIATKAGNDHMVQKILKARSKRVIIEKLVNSEDVDGNTPLHLASMHNHCNVMRSLTSDKRSDLQLVNNDGLTALDVAMESGSLSMKNPAVVQFWLWAVFTLN